MLHFLLYSDPWKGNQQTLFLRSQPHYLIDALFAVINHENWPVVAVLYDDSIGN